MQAYNQVFYCTTLHSAINFSHFLIRETQLGKAGNRHFGVVFLYNYTLYCMLLHNHICNLLSINSVKSVCAVSQCIYNYETGTFNHVALLYKKLYLRQYTVFRIGPRCVSQVNCHCVQWKQTMVVMETSNSIATKYKANRIKDIPVYRCDSMIWCVLFKMICIRAFITLSLFGVM